MKWFFALNHAGQEFDAYCDMVKVAVHSASRFTSLVPHCLFDGPDCSLTHWLRRRGVEVFRRRTFLYDRLQELAQRKNDWRIMIVGPGAFLRTELPALCAEQTITDSFVLYTDVDVMFTGDVSDLALLNPHYFAVAPEFHRDDFERMNTGVMLMNLPALRACDVRFRELMIANLEALCMDTWDQSAYRYLFRTEQGAPMWDKLDPKFNWKPYWGSGTDIRIIHFHGPKPHHYATLIGGDVPEHMKVLTRFTGGIYAAACEQWRTLLNEANRED